jgi:PKD repeat protein
MKEKLSILIAISCLLILVSMSIASVSAVDVEIEEGEEELIPIVLVHHADAGKPYSGSVGQNIQFDGSGTFIASYATYKWDFDDGNIGYGKYPTHSYSAPGEYYVTLTVKTITEKIYMDDTLVYINQENDHLEPYGGCHYHGNVAETITFDASDSVSTDPNLPIVEYIWYFSDGTKKTGQQVTHSFEDARVYTVTLYVVDSEGRTRRDFLHADINQDYTNKWDFFKNIDNTLQLILESLFDGLNDYLLEEFDVKIYTKYNNIEKYTDLDSLSQLPLSIDVNNDGPDDVVLNEIEVLKYEWGPSLFADQGMDWYQFETTLSNLDKTSNSDIGIDDDFTICLQFNFGSQLAGYLDLDTPITRIGYHSPSGEVMPDSISLTHIFKPYLMQRWRNIFNTAYETTYETTQTTDATTGTTQSATKQIASTETELAERTETTEKSVRTETIQQAATEEGTSDEGGTPVGAEDGEMEIEEESEPLESVPLVSELSPLGGLENEYWPEYGLRMECSGGTKLSMVRMFLKSETQNTGLVLNVGVDCSGPESSLVYKVKKDGGIFHRGLRFAIPQDVGEISTLFI